MQINLWEATHLKRVLKIADIRATVHLGRLKPRSRNAVLRALRSGYIPSSRYRGTGLVAHKLLTHAGVFFIWGKTSGYTYLQWNDTAKMPLGLMDKLLELQTVDRTATQVAGKTVDMYRSDQRTLRFQQLKLAHHIPPLLVDYVSSPAYRSAVEPMIRLVETGGTLEVEV